MKIADTPTLVNKVQPSGKSAAPEQAEAARPPQASDRVSLSPRARELLAARRALDAISDVRSAKVADLKARIADGTYRIDGQAIAAKMIRDAFPDDSSSQ